MKNVCAVIGLARAGAPAAKFLAEGGARVIGYDSRRLEELSDEAKSLQSLGVELKTGEHNFSGIEECSQIILSPGLKIHHEPLKSLIESCEARGAEVIGELELAARNCPAPIIAVTGTKGKSTTVKLITEMLQACGVDALRAGNTGTPLISELPKLSPRSWAVVEVSSFQLEKAPTFKPRIAVLLNLLEDHQDYHPNLQQYWATKLKIFANMTMEDGIVLNVDDVRVHDAFRKRGIFDSRDFPTPPTATLTSGREHRIGNSLGLAVHQHGGFIGYGLRNPDFAQVLAVADVPLKGAHNLSNVAAALAAIEWALDDEPPIEKLADAIRNFQSLPHRLEIVGEARGVTFVNDSQATIPEAAIKALEAFPPPVTLLCGGLAKLQNPGAFDALGKAISEKAHFLVTFGQDGPKIAESARRNGFQSGKIREVQTLAEAVPIAAQQTPRGGFVVLSPACASFDQFSSFEARGQAFREAVNQLTIVD